MTESHNTPDAEAEETFTEALRRYIVNSGTPIARLAVQAGIMPSMLFRFKNQNRSLALATVDKLCAVLGLELRPRCRSAVEANTKSKSKPKRRAAK